MDNDEYKARAVEELKNLNEQLSKARAYLVHLNDEINKKSSEFKSLNQQKESEQKMYSEEVFQLVLAENKKVRDVKLSIEETSRKIRQKESEIQTNAAILETKNEALIQKESLLSELSASLSDKQLQVFELEVEYSKLVEASTHDSQKACVLREKYEIMVTGLNNARDAFDKEKVEHREMMAEREKALIDQKKKFNERNILLDKKEKDLEDFYQKCQDMEERALSQMKVLMNTQKFLSSNK